MSLTIHEIQRRLSGLDINQEVRESIVDTKDAIKTLNQGQLFIGKRADDSYIYPDYTELTKAIKEAKGQPFDRVTLEDTGAFYDSIQIDVKSDTFDIDATDSKTNKLTKKYGEKILGLSKESKSEEYIPLYFFPELKRRIEGKLGFKMQ